MLLRLIIGLVLILHLNEHSNAQVDGRSAVSQYINHHLAKDDGAFGWEDQYDSHLTPTFAAIGVLYHLDELPENRQPLIDHVRNLHPQRNPNNNEAGTSGTELRDLVWQQIQSLLWLGGDVSEFEQRVGSWTTQAGKHANFERQGYPAFMQEMMTPIARDLLGMPQDESILPYMKERIRSNGSFNNAPVSDGGDGNILNTWWGIYAWSLLSEEQLYEGTVNWLQACQIGNGGFTHQPNPKIGVNAEVAYTWAAIKALDKLASKPYEQEWVIRYLLSLQNGDGGFGNRPGLPSTPMSTFYAIDALQTLGLLQVLDSVRLDPQDYAASQKPKDYSKYNIYTVQFQLAGSGSPQEAVMLADSMNIQLWGAKNANAEWMETAQKYADEQGVQVTFFHTNEDYGKHVEVVGMGEYNHLFDPIFPVKRNYKSDRWSLRQTYVYSENDFHNEFTKSLLKANGANLWQVNHNEPVARLLLDESVNNGGYAAISSVHFDQNFMFWLPHLYQYRHQLSVIALQDFHGTESWWWINEMLHYRNLFLAKEPTYEAMMDALRNRDIITVRHDEVTNYKTRLIGGAPGVREYVMSKVDEWKWWDDETNELHRPWAAVTVLKPEDTLEAGRPDEGVNIRVRTWYRAQREVPMEPLVELIELKVNGTAVQPELIEETDRRNRKSDAYLLYSLPQPSIGENVVEATFRQNANGSSRTLLKNFTYVQNPN